MPQSQNTMNRAPSSRSRRALPRVKGVSSALMCLNRFPATSSST